MGLESATFISGLVATNPIGASDPKSQGDDHLRLIKSVLLNTFPNLNAAMTATAAQINNLIAGLGLTSAVFKTADLDRSSNVTPADDTDLVLALGVGTYQFEIAVSWQDQVTTTQGIKGGINFSGTAGTVFCANFDALGQFGRVEAASLANSLTTANAGSVGVPQDYYWRGIIQVTVAGNLSVKWSQNTTSVNATRVLHGSYIKASRIV